MENRLIIVSNRLPYHMEFGDGQTMNFTRSVGGLVAGLSPLHDRPGNLWVGWADPPFGLDEEARGKLCEELADRRCVPVFLSEDESEGYYEGFSNSTIWPLFHGFSQFASFEDKTWKTYESVNRRFRDVVLDVARPGDVIWVQDYHLMLLPSLLRSALPDASIGFFLHIPFPGYESFRMLPWRSEIIHGIMGADLIGFHTYDYVRHFLSSCRRIAGLENRTGTILDENRVTQVDAFPMGIDYEKYRRTAAAPDARRKAGWFANEKGQESRKIMLSVERLDYSKGIPNRLQAFDTFLDRHPDWKGRVVLVLVTVPSRENVESYQELKQQIDGLVGLINGKYATIGWAPIDYYYRSLPFEQLVSMYAASDVMLVTPLRDGMNLVCKEYLACHDGRGGVLVLSEMAGAAYELHEALCVNPFDEEGMVSAIERALTMPEDEQRRRNSPMQKRLARYTSEKWSHEFLDALAEVKRRQDGMSAHLLGPTSAGRLIDAYRVAQHRVLLFDYDGTLMPFSGDPALVAPDEQLINLLNQLGSRPGNEVVVVSGRDRATLSAWLGDLPIDLVAEHGVWFCGKEDRTWTLQELMSDEWKDHVRPLLDDFVDRTPGALLEEKDYSLAWHYRMCSQELAERRVIEIKNALADGLGNAGLSILDGNKVIEVKPRNIDKGHAAHRWFRNPENDFLLAAGDDRTDEDVFEAAPDTAWTIKIGSGPTAARYALKNTVEMRDLLESLARA